MQNNIRPVRYGQGGQQLIVVAAASAATVSAFRSTGNPWIVLRHIDTVADWHGNAQFLCKGHRTAGTVRIGDADRGRLPSANSPHWPNIGSRGHSQWNRYIYTLFALFPAATATIRIFCFWAAQGLVFISIIDSQCNSLVSHGKQRGGNLVIAPPPRLFPGGPHHRVRFILCSRYVFCSLDITLPRNAVNMAKRPILHVIFYSVTKWPFLIFLAHIPLFLSDNFRHLFTRSPLSPVENFS